MLKALLAVPFAAACSGSDGAAAPRASRSSGPAAPQSPATTATPALSVEPALRRLEKRFGVRLGISATDTASGLSVGYRQDERFAMCSTFKTYAVAAVLRAHASDSGLLGRRIRFSRADLVPHSPVTENRVNSGMTVAELCGAALLQSDNTASNALLDLLGGPSAVTSFARSIGDPTTRLDRREPELNDVTPGSLLDTTTPAGMAAGYRALLLGDALARPERDRLTRWMKANRTGEDRIRAGLPEGWTAADKTGTGEYSAVNDVGVAWAPDGRSLTIAAFADKPAKNGTYEDRVIAEATEIVVKALA
ncbi:PEN family class A beta-lactamase, Bpc-type [Actinocorallia aurantiaca]|uniref:Beta-lactamase n=2 Tax=Actinocorallia aurantiaca TaxID=46204 RepID=A0ABN3TWH4_9ACTN